MKRIAQSCVVLTLAIVGHLYAQTEGKAPAPGIEGSERLPPITRRASLAISVERPQIDRSDPLIVRVTLTNRDSSPLTIEIRRDGAPYDLASLVAKGNGPSQRHDQWLMRNSPEYRDKDLRTTLRSGDSTSGDFLILFGGPPTGLPFAETGRYRVQVVCQPYGDFAPIHSNELVVTVAPGTGANEAFLRDLDALSFEYHGYDREAMLRNVGPEYHVGLDLLKRIIAQHSPHLVAPDERPEDRSEAKLVESLAGLLERHPNSAYSGYIARFLGLVHLKTFEHEISLQDGEGWNTETLRARPAYGRTYDYLVAAERTPLWPRTTALRSRTLLHIMAKEWELAEDGLQKLETDYQAVGGTQAAEDLKKQMTKFKEKLERAEAAQMNKPLRERGPGKPASSEREDHN